MSMKQLSIAVLIAFGSLVASAHAGTELMSRHQAGLYGNELYSIGKYDEALTYLRAAVYSRVEQPEAFAGLRLSDKKLPPHEWRDFARTLAEVYWEIDDASSAVYVARTLIHEPDYSLWRCKGAEQQMILDYAYDCYTSLEEHGRAQRIIRQQSVFDSDR